MFIASTRAPTATAPTFRTAGCMAVLLTVSGLAVPACSLGDPGSMSALASGEGLTPAAVNAEARFAARWRDGRAEVSGYRLTVTRYGVPRSGDAAMIFVTEPFLEGARVKPSGTAGADSDAFEVMKLNLSRNFQTGIYPYHTMTSAFLRTADLTPVKAAFSSTEWCGQVYHQLVFREREIEQCVASYFEGESSAAPLPAPPRGAAPPITEDALFVSLRGLKGAFLDAGERREVAFLPSLFRARLTHTGLAWSSAEISRDRDRIVVDVPAGRFSCERYRVRVEDGPDGQVRVGEFDVEQAPPRRIVRWSWTLGSGGPYEAADSGELMGSTRLKYWELNGPGGEDVSNALGLPPIPAGP